MNIKQSKAELHHFNPECHCSTSGKGKKKKRMNYAERKGESDNSSQKIKPEKKPTGT